MKNRDALCGTARPKNFLFLRRIPIDLLKYGRTMVSAFGKNKGKVERYRILLFYRLA